MEKYLAEKRKVCGNISDNLYALLEDNKCIIAGGIISRVFSGRSTVDADIDVYFRDKYALRNVLMGIGGSGDIVFDYTDKSVMIKSGDAVVQFIIIDYFQKAEDIFAKFDFTCVMGALDLSNFEFVFHEDFLVHNAQRKLVFNPQTSFPVISAFRVDKYKKEGYSISRREYAKILVSIMKMTLTSWDDVEKQFGKFYGTNISQIITDELKSQEFSLDALLESLSSMNIDDNLMYTGRDNPKSIPDWEKFVQNITQLKPDIVYWEKGNSFYRQGSYALYKITEDNIDIDEYENHITLPDDKYIYKYVIKTEDGKLLAPLHTNYEYNIGKIASGGGHGLYFYRVWGISQAKKSYGQEDNRVLLECAPVGEVIEDYSFDPDSQFRVMGAMPIRIVPRDEERELVALSRLAQYYNDDIPF